MADLYVTDLTGQMELLTDYQKDSLEIKERVNGEYSLSFVLVKTPRNEFAYDLVQEESIIEYAGQQYVIKNLTENSKGVRAIKSITAEHIFFSLIDDYFYDQLVAGEYEINYLLSRIFEGTGYTYTVEGTFTPQYFESFGLNNVLSLVNLICTTFNVEIYRNNKHVTFKQQIGNDIDFQFRYRYNTKTISKNVSTSNLSTVIRGYCDVDEYGIYHVEATYRSPMVDIYGTRHAAPIYADDLVYESSLMTRLQQSINDKPDVSYSLEFVELRKQGFPEDNFSLGDTVYTIWEPLNIDIQTRIVECTRYPESAKSPVVTLANFKNNASDIIADFGKTKENIDKIITDGGKVRFSALEEAVKRATVALNNSMTQLEYPEDMGIVARDPNNPNKFVVFRSNGIGITVDGGRTFKEAITAEGFVLSAGVVGQLTAENIDVKGLAVERLRSEKAGKVVADLYQDSYGGYLKLYDPTGLLKFNLHTNQSDNGGRMTILDANGVSKLLLSANGEQNGGQISIIGEDNKGLTTILGNQLSMYEETNNNLFLRLQDENSSGSIKVMDLNQNITNPKVEIDANPVYEKGSIITRDTNGNIDCQIGNDNNVIGGDLMVKGKIYQNGAVVLNEQEIRNLVESMMNP